MKAWIARDESGLLWLYHGKPIKISKTDMWESADGEFIELYPSLFPSVKWEDDEPTEVEITIKLKGEEKKK